MNVQNTLVSYITDINVATHNGAANIYAYGSDIVVHVDEAWLYSSGPAAHGLYASGDCMIIATDIQHQSGGNRCSLPAWYSTLSERQNKTKQFIILITLHIPTSNRSKQE